MGTVVCYLFDNNWSFHKLCFYKWCNLCQLEFSDFSKFGNWQLVVGSWLLIVDCWMLNVNENRDEGVFVFPIKASSCQWFSGKIQRCHRWAPGSIPGWRMTLWGRPYDSTYVFPLAIRWNTAHLESYVQDCR